jgi:cell division protein FtsB
MTRQLRAQSKTNEPDPAPAPEEAPKKKKQGARAPLAQFVAIIALTISVFLIIDLGRRAAANYRVQREAERLGQEVEQARFEQERLVARRSYVASDIFIEEVARRDLKWARPGETVVVVMSQAEPLSLGPDPDKAPVPADPIPQTPFQAWWILFFDTNPPPYLMTGP